MGKAVVAAPGSGALAGQLWGNELDLVAVGIGHVHGAHGQHRVRPVANLDSRIRQRSSRFIEDLRRDRERQVMQRAWFPESLSPRGKRYQDEKRRNAISRLPGAKKYWTGPIWGSHPLEPKQLTVESDGP